MNRYTTLYLALVVACSSCAICSDYNITLNNKDHIINRLVFENNNFSMLHKKNYIIIKY